MLIILPLIFIICILYFIIINKKNESGSSDNKKDDSDTETVNEIIDNIEHNNTSNLEHFTDILPLYFDKPSKLFNLYFPYIDTEYMNNKLKYNSIDTMIQSIDGYENKIYKLITNNKYDKLFEGIFIIKPEYKIFAGRRDSIWPRKTVVDKNF